MKTGYARVSTKEQTVVLQVDALKKAGCTKVYTEIMSGTRALAHGGNIWLERKEPGWTAFILALPCLEKNDASTLNKVRIAGVN